MTRRYFLLPLLFGMLLLTPKPAAAVEEEAVVLNPVAETVTLSEEDQKIVAMLELLEMMELLDELETVAALEENP